MMYVTDKTVKLVSKVSTYIIANIEALPSRLASKLAIMSVSSFKAAVTL